MVIARGGLVYRDCVDQNFPGAPLLHALSQLLFGDRLWSFRLLDALLMLGKQRKHWFEVGASCVVIDTLVHNFLHRTGILRRLGADHPYGMGCYRPGGCADLLQVIAQEIDVSVLNPKYPRLFPRFVQSAIWRYCAGNGLDICNGNRIDDRGRCNNVYCRLHGRCDRIALADGTSKTRVFSAV